MTQLKEEQIEENRSRLYAILLYEDTESYIFDEVLRNLKSYKRYAYIKHLPEKDELKEHYHFILRTDNPISIKSLCKKTGILPQHVKKIKNERSMCRYLTHIDDEDKIQYNIDDVKVSKLYQDYYRNCFDDLKTEEEVLLDIFSKLDEISKLDPVDRLRSLILFLNINHYYSIYNRYKKMFDSYINYNI